jgi:hypothetical protein
MPTTFFSLRGNVFLELLVSAYQTACVTTILPKQKCVCARRVRPVGGWMYKFTCSKLDARRDEWSGSRPTRVIHTDLASVKADPHIPCRSHAVLLPFPCRSPAVPLPFSYHTVLLSR